MRTHKYFEEMCDMNKLFIATEVNCCVCEKIIHKKDKKFWNPKNGTVIHQECYIQEILKLKKLTGIESLKSEYIVERL